MKYSVIILLEEKSEKFVHLIEMIHEIFSSRQDPFEILIIANGLEAFLKRELEKIANLNHYLKAFTLNKKNSTAIALKAAYEESSGDIIVVCGSYLQVSKKSFSELLNALDDKTDIITPWRYNRVDPAFNQFQSRAFNLLVNKIMRSDIKDLSCTLKIFRREVLENIKLYGNMYRYLPIVAIKNGFRNKQVKCEHFQEFGKTGFYGLRSYLGRITDIFTLYFNTRFSKTPLRFFSLLGAGFFGIGLFLNTYVFIQKIFLGLPIGDRPILLLAVLFMVMGAQAATVGLLGEIIAFTHGRQKKGYTIEKSI